MKAIGIAELKARLSEHLREVRRGRSLTILDRKNPVARIVPYEGTSEALRIRRPLSDAPRPCDMALPRPTPLKCDVVDLLLEDHGSGR